MHLSAKAVSSHAALTLLPKKAIYGIEMDFIFHAQTKKKFISLFLY